MNITEIIDFLKSYDGKELTFMEVCGTHTAAISENGIPSLISNKIHLVSGPGCPVCVTPSSYIDKLIELSESNVVVTFGDMIRVPGSKESLYDAKARGNDVRMIYSPFEITELAEKEKDKSFVFAAVGFETTTPIYALLIKDMVEKGIENVKLLTALKTMPPVIDTLCQKEHNFDGFIAPGHVAVITGSNAFLPLAEKYSLPFVVSGFKAEELLATIYALVKMAGNGKVKNLYKSAVTESGNKEAKAVVNKYFEPCNASWRGLGIIENSGMKIKDEYQRFDAGSVNLTADNKFSSGCRCGEIIAGLKKPNDCPLFAKTCNPEHPKGACMVSNEGSCFHYFINQRG